MAQERSGEMQPRVQIEFSCVIVIIDQMWALAHFFEVTAPIPIVHDVLTLLSTSQWVSQGALYLQSKALAE